MFEEHTSSVIDDREWYMLAGFARYRRLFFDRILPWLVFAGIIYGLYLFMLHSVELIVLISEPLSEGMKAMGL